MFNKFMEWWRYSTPSTFLVFTNLFLWFAEQFTFSGMEKELIQELGLYGTIFATGWLFGLVWADQTKSGSSLRKWWVNRDLPVQLEPICCTSIDQSGLQDGMKRHQFFARVTNHGKKMRTGICVKCDIHHADAKEYKTYIFEIDKLHGNEIKDVPCLEFISKDDCSLLQYEVLNDKNSNSRPLSVFEEKLRIFSCLATDQQPQTCEGWATISCPKTNPDLRVSVKTTGFNYE